MMLLEAKKDLLSWEMISGSMMKSSRENRDMHSDSTCSADSVAGDYHH